VLEGGNAAIKAQDLNVTGSVDAQQTHAKMTLVGVVAYFTKLELVHKDAMDAQALFLAALENVRRANAYVRNAKGIQKLINA